MDCILIFTAFFCSAALYASVGHAGASAYLLVMALMGMSWMEAKPVALLLNVAVAILATWVWGKHCRFDWKLFTPLVLGSVPASYVSSHFVMNEALFRYGLAATLTLAAFKLISSHTEKQRETRRISTAVLLLIGAAIGCIAGWLGVGGGVLLTPILMMLRAATTSVIAAVSAAFILVNSVSGLVGWLQQGYAVPSMVWPLMPLVMLGALMGAKWGSSSASQVGIKRCLSAVMMVAVGKLIYFTS
jgi:uncharacterized protein